MGNEEAYTGLGVEMGCSSPSGTIGLRKVDVCSSDASGAANFDKACSASSGMPGEATMEFSGGAAMHRLG